MNKVDLWDIQVNANGCRQANRLARPVQSQLYILRFLREDEKLRKEQRRR